jgi:hypothetical protein
VGTGAAALVAEPAPPSAANAGLPNVTAANAAKDTNDRMVHLLAGILQCPLPATKVGRI